MTESSPQEAISRWGRTLSTFLLVSYIVRIIFSLMVPQKLHLHAAWAPLLPGFKGMTLRGIVAGAGGSFANGWYVALLVVLLYRFLGRERA